MKRYLWGACAMLACVGSAAHADPAHVQAQTTCGGKSYENLQEVPMQVGLDGLPCPPGPNRGTYADGSTATSTSALTIFTANTSRVRIKLINTDYVTASGGGGLIIWCRWGTSGAAPAAAHGVKSFPLFPGAGIDDIGSGVNTSAVNCISESGTPVLFAEQY